uniref:Uncharacterized protein n=2 Tax=Kalanchoe fedtschenkoi TaxID=63787 RepID=A0A7N0TM49_KALFE
MKSGYGNGASNVIPIDSSAIGLFQGAELEPQPTIAAPAAATTPAESSKSDMFAANAQRMQVVMNRLSFVLRSVNKGVQQLEQPLLALARGIDFSVANGEVPSKAPELSSLVKQICQQKSDILALPLIMVLMVSIKNACKLGWFSATDTKEIIDLYKEISSSFCLPENVDAEPSPSNPNIQTYMER